MKNFPSKLLFVAVLALPFSGAQAQIFPALPEFNTDTGVLQIPTMRFQGKLYYLDLSIASAADLTMKIEESSLVDISPDGSTVGVTNSDILGTWDVDGEQTAITFNEDGTFALVQAAGADLESCPDGGTESGTFRFNAATGVFMPTFQVDENGHCGISSAGAVIRLFPDGNSMRLMIGTELAANLVLRQ